MLRHAVPGPGAQLIHRPPRFRDADDRHVEMTAASHRLQGREDLLVGQVPGRTEEDERVRRRGGHDFFSTWPPNSNRMAESRRSWNSASPRELKRSKSEAARTCAGTPSSIAASSVHRPSPESETRPEKRSSFGSCASAAAVRSRSHEATTLPRRQTSAIYARSNSYG